MAAKTAITPTRQEDYPEWYQQVVKQGDLAENSSVRGCMVIKPWGYGLWENIQKTLDKKFKATGHKNAYFPLLIPVSLLAKEAEHVEGFAMETAVVTHHRLQKDGKGGLEPAGQLEEPYVIRPTSEMVINETYSKWVQSYRDLPILINQWANVFRWEMRTRLFMRTAEFLWQEGHTVHATAEEAMEETVMIHTEAYADFMENWLAMPVINGRKSDSERFPGAVETFTNEAMMQDGKALQAGTSHFLGQNFSKAMDIKFQDKDGQEKHAWTTSWGVSTRMIGGMIMTHSDDDGLVIPPRIAPAHAVILPILKGKDLDADDKILAFAKDIAAKLNGITYHEREVEVEVDARDIPGKKWDWVRKGVPLRIEIGGKEVEAGEVSIQRRDEDGRTRHNMSVDDCVAKITSILDEMQKGMFDRAKALQIENTVFVENKDDFYAAFKEKKGQIAATGFVKAYWDGDEATEKQVKDDLNVTIRCLPTDEQNDVDGKVCALSGKPAKHLAVFAKAY